MAVTGGWTRWWLLLFASWNHSRKYLRWRCSWWTSNKREEVERKEVWGWSFMGKRSIVVPLLYSLKSYLLSSRVYLWPFLEVILFLNKGMGLHGWESCVCEREREWERAREFDCIRSVQPSQSTLLPFPP